MYKLKFTRHQPAADLGGIELTWADNSTNETGFTVQRSTSGDFIHPVSFNVGANVTYYKDTTAVAGTTYTYRVYADGASPAPNSGYSNTSACTIPVITLQSLTVTDAGAGNTNASATATAPENAQPPTLYVPLNNATGTATITLSALTNTTAYKALSHVDWSITGNNANPASGTFGGTTNPSVVLTPTGGNYDFVVTANLNMGTSQGGPQVLTVDVDLFSLGVTFGTGTGTGTPPPQIIQVDNNNTNGNAVPDFAEGYTYPNQQTVPPAVATPSNFQSFTPLQIILAGAVNLSTSDLTLNYSGSDPTAVTVSGTNTYADPYIYTPAPGSIRVWTADSGTSRNGAGIASGGNYITPGVSFAASLLNFVSGTGGVETATVYVEAVAASVTAGDITISASFTDGGSGVTGAGPATSAVATAGATATAASAQARVDYAQNGVIDFTGTSDLTTAAHPYAFWLNDNADVPDSTFSLQTDPSYQGEVPVGMIAPQTSDFYPNVIPADNTLSKIPCELDLQDYARVQFHWNTAFQFDHASFQFDSVTNGAPSIRVVPSTDATDNYLFSESAATAEMNFANTHWAQSFVIGSGQATVETASQLFSIPGFYTGNGSNQLNMLFEGLTAGSGALTVTFYDGHGNVVATTSVDMQLQSANSMYNTYSILNAQNTNTAPNPETTPYPTSATQVGTSTVAGTRWQTNDMIVFVHGWNMAPTDKVEFANTAFKRLFWEGYRGSFAAFDWPTEVSGPTGFTHLLNDTGVMANFDRSEEKAWNSGAALASLLGQLNTQYSGNVAVFAHSMGNVVVSEALRQMKAAGQPPVSAYIATQAATWAQAYDSNQYTPNANTNEDLYKWLELSSSPSVPYFGSGQMDASNFSNFYNPVDPALVDEKLMNYEFKPLPTAKIDSNQYIVSSPWVYADASLTLDNWSQRYEILAFINEAQGTPLGMDGNTGGPFSPSNAVDLNSQNGTGTLGFNFGGNIDQSHSAEFLSTNPERHLYWYQLLVECNFTKDYPKGVGLRQDEGAPNLTGQ